MKIRQVDEELVLPEGVHEVMCYRKKHLVEVRGERVLFLNHGSASYAALKAEGQIRALEEPHGKEVRTFGRGCFALVHEILTTKSPEDWGRHRSRRTSEQAALVAAGCPDSFFPVLLALAKRRYRRTHGAKPGVDYYAQPFISTETWRGRFHDLQALTKQRVDEKFNRVYAKAKARLIDAKGTSR